MLTTGTAYGSGSSMTSYKTGGWVAVVVSTLFQGACLFLKKPKSDLAALYAGEERWYFYRFLNLRPETGVMMGLRVASEM